MRQCASIVLKCKINHLMVPLPLTIIYSPFFSVLLFFQMLSTNKHSNEWTVLACVCKMLLKKESKTFYNIFFGWTKPL